jgi:pimeloyl-ACP methyl ester carboxylesterase
VLRVAVSVSLFVLLLVAPACDQTEPVNPDLLPGAHVFTAADGLEIPYDVHGDGETTVVLVHCWMCARGFWDAQVPVLENEFRVIAMDLGGHGEAGATREEWTIAGYGEDVAALIEHLGLDRVVLVGHSMGGSVALKAAALSSGRILGIVAVDTLHDAEFDYNQPAAQRMVEAFQERFAETCTQFVGFMFPEEGVDEIEDEVRRVGCEQSNPDVGKALMLDFGRIDMVAWFQQAGVPIRAINAATPNPTQIETNRKYADFDAVLMEGVGHYPHMTRPEDFNPLLLQAIDGMTR